MCTVGEDLRDQREIGKLLSSHFEICRLPRYLPISQMISQMFITLSFGPVYGCLEQGNRYHLKPRARAVSSEDPANFLPYLAVQMVWVSTHLECFELPSFYSGAVCTAVYFFCQVEITIFILLLYFVNDV